MDIKELQQKSPDELRRLIAEWQTLLRDGRFQFATRQMGKLKSVRQARRDIARVETILRQKSN